MSGPTASSTMHQGALGVGVVNATRRSINRAMIVVGAPVGGAVGDLIGLRAMLWPAAAGILLAAFGLALTEFRRARLDDTRTSASWA